MAKTYHLKLTGGDVVDVSEEEFRLIEQPIYAKADRMVQASGTMFSARDVRRVTSTYETDVPEYYQAEIKDISEEQRARNLRRMRWIRAYIFGKHHLPTGIPEEEWEGYKKFAAWYESPVQVEKRRLKKQFKAEFFDVYFSDHDEMEYCFQSWLPFHDGSRDPRDYRRTDHTPEALGLREANSLLKTASAAANPVEN